jgi:hypothetical protein
LICEIIDQEVVNTEKRFRKAYSRLGYVDIGEKWQEFQQWLTGVRKDVKSQILETLENEENQEERVPISNEFVDVNSDLNAALFNIAKEVGATKEDIDKLRDFVIAAGAGDEKDFYSTFTKLFRSIKKNGNGCKKDSHEKEMAAARQQILELRVDLEIMEVKLDAAQKEKAALELRNMALVHIPDRLRVVMNDLSIVHNDAMEDIMLLRKRLIDLEIYNREQSVIIYGLRKKLSEASLAYAALVDEVTASDVKGK